MISDVALSELKKGLIQASDRNASACTQITFELILL